MGTLVFLTTQCWKLTSPRTLTVLTSVKSQSCQSPARLHDMGLWIHEAPRPISTEFGTSANVPENRQKVPQWSLSCLPTDPKGFPGSSVGKESTCNAGDPGSIPGSGRSTGGGIEYPLRCPWASLVAQLVKNLPAMLETWVRSLGWEDNPGEGKDYPLQYSASRIPWIV